MQVTFPIAVSCLHILFTLFTPVRSMLQITNSSTQGTVVVENTPFKLWCTVIDTENKIVNGSFEWKQENISSPGNPITLHNDSPDLNITQTNKDNKSITSILTLKKPPPIFDTSFYYTCKFEDKTSELPVTVIRADEVPHVSLGNKTNPTVSSIVVSFGEKVELICLVSRKKIKKYNPVDVKLTLTLKKEKGKTLNKKSFSKKELSKMKENFLFKVTVDIESSLDGGVYFCESQYLVNVHAFNDISSVELRITPKVNGDIGEKEVKAFAGKDVKLKCDIVGYPLEYEWQFEDGTKITGETDSRYLVTNTTLVINDIKYDDRKKYICIGIYSNGEKTIKQTIILRVKDPLAPLWPFIGIVIEIFIVAAIIIGTEQYQKRKTETDGGDETTDNDPASTTYVT